ncbi:MAG: hypothetical protein WCC84_01125, partial [Candidatus Cybelea sp.]
MRLLTSTLFVSTAIAVLAGRSAGTAATPSAKTAFAKQTVLALTQSHTKNLDLSAPKPGSSVEVALQLNNADSGQGSYHVTAVNGGSNRPQTNCGHGQVALHENAKSIGPRETFNLISVGPNTYAFKTLSGYYVTAVNGGDIGRPNQGRNVSLLHTNAISIGSWEEFYIVTVGSNPLHVAIEPRISSTTSRPLTMVVAARKMTCRSTPTQPRSVPGNSS